MLEKITNIIITVAFGTFRSVDDNVHNSASGNPDS